MFTGIIEALGTIREIIPLGTNKTFWINSDLSSQLKVDQSVNHSGVCLTIEEIRDNRHRVTVIDETLKKTCLGGLTNGTVLNLERSLKLDDRLDGHLVQGHVDSTGICVKKKEKYGSWEFVFEFPSKFAPLVIEKGSVAINGISLTAFDVKKKSLRVAVIPYTFDHTNLNELREGSIVNIEFDLIGKYLFRRLSLDKGD